jgi:hypothetical protein
LALSVLTCSNVGLEQFTVVTTALPGYHGAVYFLGQKKNDSVNCSNPTFEHVKTLSANIPAAKADDAEGSAVSPSERGRRDAARCGTSRSKAS